jgi:hypothetical protein
MSASERWPPLPYEEWKDTLTTLHLWTQIVGKVKLQLSPFLNELWNTGFRVTARGLTTETMKFRDTILEVRFDFVDHNLEVLTADGRVAVMALLPRSVADFYAEFMGILHALGVDIEISRQAVEMPLQVRLDGDREHASYDPDYVNRWWRILVQTDMVLQRYRSSFTGKSSPPIFYWGGFDLAEGRYSGRTMQVEGPSFYRLAEDEENVSCGFWPGNPTMTGVSLGQAAFYSYTNPAPEGFAGAEVRPKEARFNSQLGEFILLYEDVRQSPSPEDTILQFFQSTYEAGASLGNWDRSRLERTPPTPSAHHST